jgi:hypothetical protein
MPFLKTNLDSEAPMLTLDQQLYQSAVKGKAQSDVASRWQLWPVRADRRPYEAIDEQLASTLYLLS